ncbi:MAG: restriction endonuclease subunit S [Candidatus Poribacteria bacterium]|nr:restriction endonuclease subunit S [Candidatus Poribacteria bacterium]
MSSWRNITVGNLGEVVTGYTPPTKNAEYFGDVYPFITPTDITIDSRTVQTERFLSQEGYEYNKNRLLPPNAVCVTCIASIGKICMTTVPSVTNQQINSIVVNENKHNPYFVYYLLITKTDVLHSVANKATTPIVNKSTFASINVCVPPLQTQTQIATFLDRKTEQIDELIRIKERQIELLQEQRTTLINKAVTKGLDPNVGMKPSDVEWIGEIPAHWKIEKIKHVATLVSEKSTPETDAIKISPENVESETGKVLDFYSSYDAVGVKFQDGDVLFNKIRVYLSKVVFAKCDGYSLGEMIVIRPTLQCMNKYLFYLMLSNCFIEYCDSISYGAKMPRTAVDDILNTKIPIPLDQEKLQIANFLDDKTEQIDELIAAEQRKIERLKEYRQSLISEAVTGKIDVRNEV